MPGPNTKEGMEAGTGRGRRKGTEVVGSCFIASTRHSATNAQPHMPSRRLRFLEYSCSRLRRHDVSYHPAILFSSPRVRDNIMSHTRTALVTGANKGVGLAIVRNLALQYPSSAFNNGPLLIYLSARDQRRGEDAVADLLQDIQLKKAKALAEHGGLSTIKYHGMDISKSQSIKDMAGFLKKKHPDGIDIVVNNAGIAMEGFGTLLCPSMMQTSRLVFK